MLSIGTVSAGNQAQREYHERQLAEARDDYYRESEGPPGTWVGQMATQMGLEGEVTVEQFRRLLDGQDPTSGDVLAPSLAKRKTLAFDLAFSAPKSVSLMRMAVDEPTSKTIDRAHERAVRAALAYVEQEGWKGRQRVDGKRVATQGRGVVGVLYRHETTRNADPQLHSHAVLANVVDDGNGPVTAVNSSILFWQAKTAGTVYQAVLRGELGRELGIEFDAPVNGLADIKGFDRELIESWSTRRAEILEGLKAQGFEGNRGGAAERVALESRRAKDMQLDHHLWRTEVRETLARTGFGRDQAAAFVVPTEERVPVGVGERLASAPLGRLADQRAHEDERPVRQAAMNVAEGYTADEVSEALERAFADPRIVQVSAGDKPRWTTVEHLDLEEQVRRAALLRAGETTAPRITVEGYEVPRRTPDGHLLSAEQRHVLDELLTSGRGVEVVRARAGAGKTTIAGLAKTELEDHGYRVVGVAPTLQALAELDDVGLEVRDTLARTALGAGEYSPVMRTMDHQTVVIVDEAAMSQTKEIAPLLRRAAETGAKVIAIGDDVQLAAVGAGGWVRYLAEHEAMPVLELTEVHRQRDPVERARLNDVHRGDVAGWTRWADQHDRIAITPTVEEAYDEAVSRYAVALEAVDGDVDRLVVMAPQNAHRHELNERLRRIVVDRGIVDQDQAVELHGLRVAPGERLVATTTVKNPAGFGRLVENGERFEVLDVGAAGVRARAVAGARRGDVVLLPAAVFARDRSGRAVEHGYARTVHKGQGMTVDRAILFAPDPTSMGRNLAYVGITRTRERTDLVTVAPDRAEGLERLVRGMSERRDHQAAVALIDREQLDPARLGRMGDRELDEHRHALLTEAREAMTRLARLDREAREAWAASGDARTDAGLLAQRDRLAASIEDREAHLAEQDPTGDRQRRPLMERAIRQGIDRDRETLERLDEQLAGRPVLPVDVADETQARIREERAGVERYVDALLEDLEHVHGQQVDRTPGPVVDPRSVPEHERPALAQRQENERRGRALELDLAAGQQLGTGHPLVARWLERHAPAVERPAAAEARAIHLTPHQQAFAEAVERWQRVGEQWGKLGAHRGYDELMQTTQRLAAARERLDETVRERDEHPHREPSRLRRSAHEAWEREGEDLGVRVDQAAELFRRAEGQRQAVEERLGLPLVDALRTSEKLQEQTQQARAAAIAAEQTVLRAGPGAGDRRHLEAQLGRRDVLAPASQRRYDQLAGRIAVRDALQTVEQGEGRRWVPINAAGVDRDVARWRGEKGLPLTGRQQQIAADRDADRRADHGGPDPGR